MTDDPLVQEWQRIESPARSVDEAVAAALVRDRSERDRDRATRLLSFGCAIVLWPILLWAAAHGVTPVVRGGYALMAAGTAVMLFAEFAYSSWARRTQPGPIDAMTQLRETVGLLRLQAGLVRWAAAWASPIFVGTGLIGWWTYTERSHTGAAVLWLIVAAGWVASALGGERGRRVLDARRERLEHVLSDLGS